MPLLLEDPALKLTPLSELKKRARPPKTEKKISVSVRYPPDVIQAFNASGSGWQTRMDAALKEWLKHHHPAELKI